MESTDSLKNETQNPAGTTRQTTSWRRYLLVLAAVSVVASFAHRFRVLAYVYLPGVLVLYPAYWAAEQIAPGVRIQLRAMESAWRSPEDVQGVLFGILVFPYLAVCLLPIKFRRSLLGLGWPTLQIIVFLPGLAWGILEVIKVIIGFGTLRPS